MMKNSILLILMIVAVVCALFTGCGEDKNTNETTTRNDTTQTTNDVTAESETQTSTTPSDVEITVPNVEELTFQDFNSMSQEEQQVVVDSFDNPGEFFDWYEEKEEEYKENPVPPTTEGPIFPDAPDVSVPDKRDVTYLEYHAMSGDEQMAFINTFNSSADFVAWHTAARKAYEDSMIVIDGTTPIDLGELIGTTEGNN